MTDYFDAIQLSKKLKDSGIAGMQAVAVPQDYNPAQSESDPVTRHDVDILGRDMKAEMYLLRKAAKELELRVTIKLGAIIIVTLSVVFILVKLTS